MEAEFVSYSLWSREFRVRGGWPPNRTRSQLETRPESKGKTKTKIVSGLPVIQPEPENHERLPGRRLCGNDLSRPIF
jgi:hypothetical protein